MSVQTPDKIRDYRLYISDLKSYIISEINSRTGSCKSESWKLLNGL